MANPENSSRRIVGVRTVSAGPVLFCEAGDLTLAAGDWVLVESESGTFPARVVLPDSLIEAVQLPDNLAKVVGMAGATHLVEGGISWAVEAEVSRKFAELSAAQGWPYLLKEVEARAGRLIVRIAADPEPDEQNFVPLLKELAGIAKTRVELFLVSEATAPARPSTDAEFGGWVNGLLKELDPAVLAKAAVGEPLLDESEIYRPGQRLKTNEKPAQQDLYSETGRPVATYDPANRG